MIIVGEEFRANSRSVQDGLRDFSDRVMGGSASAGQQQQQQQQQAEEGREGGAEAGEAKE